MVNSAVRGKIRDPNRRLLVEEHALIRSCEELTLRYSQSGMNVVYTRYSIKGGLFSHLLDLLKEEVMRTFFIPSF